LRGFCREKTVVSERFRLPSFLTSPRFVNHPILPITPPLLKYVFDFCCCFIVY
jgi:hypothetical protein